MNTYSSVRNDRGSAVYKADSYAQRIGGTSGRLLTYEEVNNLKGNYSDMIWVTYGISKYYWVGSAYNSLQVWFVHGESGGMYYNYYYSTGNYGVRPVVKILKSKIS